MKVLWLATLVLACSAALARADLGAEAYRRGDFAAARAHWSAALAVDPPPARPERARLCFNVGNAASREERFAEAAAWYTSAVRLAPRDRAAWANLELARSEAGFGPADRGDLSATFERLLGMWTAAESEWLALGAICLWALALGYEALRGGRVARRLAWTGFFLVLVASLPAVRHALSEQAEPAFVLAKDGAELASEPREGAAKLARAPGGAVVERLDALPGWVKLRLGSGEVGWARSSELFALAR